MTHIASIKTKLKNLALARGFGLNINLPMVVVHHDLL